MKLPLAFAAVACATVAPPRIELQLDESLKLRKTKAMTETTRFQPSGNRVMSRKDYTVVCQAGDGVSKCPMPKAQAFDSVDNQVTDRPKSSSLIRTAPKPCHVMSRHYCYYRRKPCCH